MTAKVCRNHLIGRHHTGWMRIDIVCIGGNDIHPPLSYESPGSSPHLWSEVPH